MTKRSDVWKHFEKYGEEAKCLICKKNISCKGSTTTGLRNHLLIHNIQLGLDHISDNEPPSKKHSTQSLLPSFSKKQSLDEVIARLAAEDGFSYLKISQSKFIRSSLKEKGFTPIQDHSTVSRMVLRYANHVKGVITSHLQFLLANGKRMSVSLDEYTSVQNKRYMNVNIHSINEFWNLGMKRIYGKMPAEKVLELLERILIEFNIELQKHIVSITCDGAPVMVKMGRLSGINQQLCLAHGVHLAVVAVLYSKNSIPIYDEGTDEEPNGTSQIQSTISDSYNDGLCGAEDTEGEFNLSDEDDGEIDEDVYIPPLKINIKTVIVKCRNIVRIFRRSPLKNEVLQSYIKEDLGKTLNLVLDCKTRWNSLISMISRLLTVRKPLCKAMIDINLKMEICELDWQVLENICSCLKPIEMGISALCQRDANLLSAEGIFDFMFQKLETVGSDFALELLQKLRQRFNERRQSNLINVMKYLLNPDSIREDPCIKRKEVQKTMKIILSQLYSQHGTEQSDNVIADSQEILEDIEDVEIHSSPILLTDQLKRAIQKSTTHVKTPKEDIGFLFLIKEMALFEATGDKSKNISSIEEVLNTIPPTSVEAERAFSAAGLFVTKLRSRLSENSVDSLMILKSYFKKQEIK